MSRLEEALETYSGYHQQSFGGQRVLDVHGLTETIELRTNGAPRILMIDAFDRSHYEPYTNAPPESMFSHEIKELRFVAHQASTCDRCGQVAICKSDPAPDNFDSGSIPGNCGVVHNDVSECDQIASSASGFASGGDCGVGACQGAEGCGGGHGGHGAGDVCGDSIPSSRTLSMASGSLSKGVCGAPTVPHYCKSVSGGVLGGECAVTPYQKERRARHWAQMMGCGIGGVGKSSSTVCTAGGACVDTGVGVYHCVQCDEGGSCSEGFVDTRDPVSPYVQGGGGGQGKKIDAAYKCGETMSDTCCFSGGVETSCPSTLVKKGGSSQPSAAQKPTAPVGEASKTKASRGPQQSTAPKKKAKTQQRSKEKAKASPKEVETQETLNKQKPKGKEASLDKKAKVEKEAPKADGDPVLLSSGALDIVHTDLSFPGTGRDLVFVRSYNSKGSNRGILGSNWTHNYDEHLIPIKPGNAPLWVPEYCTAYYPFTTCVIHHASGGSQTLYMRSPGDENGLFLPQAGSAETIKRYYDAWTMRSPDNHVRTFNSKGSLVADMDRFGNGVTIEYELTPVGREYARYCRVRGAPVSARPSPTPVLTASAGNGPVYVEELEFEYNGQFDERYCRVLSSILGEEPLVHIGPEGWAPKETKNGVTYESIMQPKFDLFKDLYFKPLATLDVEDPPPPLPTHLKTDADYVREILNLHASPGVPTGELRQRPVSVTDDMGRRLEFVYHDNPNDMVKFGLLKEIRGPSDLASIQYDYARPADYPAEIGESFLTKVTRQDSTQADAHLQSRDAKVIDFKYAWPKGADDSYLAHTDEVHDAYLDYYSTMNGCRWSSQNQVETEIAVCGGGGGGGGGPGGPGGSPGGFGAGPVTVCGPNGKEVTGYQTPFSADAAAERCARARHSYSSNPCFMADASMNQYISDVADNLIQVKRFDRIEVETRYEEDPKSQSFDRVLVQRYGGLPHTEYGQSLPRTAGDWESDTPEFSFEYLATRPLPDGTDVTEGATMLPYALKTKFPLEPEDPKVPWVPIDSCFENPTAASCPHVDSDTAAYRPVCSSDGTHELVNREDARCNPNRQTSMRMKLPGFFKTRTWFDLQDPSPGTHPRLYRSRLTCHQIAVHYDSDATHNGLIEELVEKNSERTWKLIEGSRAKLQADHRRICAWTKVTDRDGDVRYIGMNFRGQAVVEAEDVSLRNPVSGNVSTELFTTETLYNADGLMIEQRHPSPVSSLWTSSDGYDTVVYEEIDPKGNNGWNQWLPLWWTKRFNMVEQWSYPRQDSGVTPAYAYTWDGQSDSLVKTQVTRQGREIEYEPIFNQPRRIETKVEYTGGQTDSDVMVIDYDYQEIQKDTAEFFEAYSQQFSWAWQWPSESTPTQAERQAWFTDMLVPQPSYGDQDLNNDGHLGFPVHADDLEEVEFLKLRGFPVRMTWFGRNGSGEQKVRWMKPTPHGRPAQIAYEDGRLVDFLYYHENHTNDVNNLSTQYRGFLAKAITHRYDSEDMPTSEAPTDAPGYANATPCTQLKAPFQWILPGGCGSNLSSELRQKLGLPLDAYIQLLKGNGTEETSFLYNTAGHVRRVNQPGGLFQEMMRDVDGLVFKTTDAKGGITTTERSPEGWALSTKVHESDSTLVRASYAEYDNEGRVLARCTEVTSGGCAGVLSTTGITAFDKTRVTSNPSHLLETYRYTPEGLLWKTRDAMGTETEYAYDDRGLQTYAAVKSGLNLGQLRSRYMDYDHHGWLIRVRQGDKEERHSYDGYGRQIGMQDMQKADHKTAYNGWGEVVAQRPSLLAYAAGQELEPGEVRYKHGAFGEVEKSLDAAGNERVVTYDTFKRPFRIDVYPGGTAPANSSWLYHDKTGTLAWSLDAVGNQTLHVQDAGGRKVIRSRIVTEELPGDQKGPSITQISTVDLAGYPETMGHVDRDNSMQFWQYDYSAAGDLLHTVNPEGVISADHTYNLAGWITDTESPDSQYTQVTQASVMTNRQYNAYGQVIKTIEPGDQPQHTTYLFNGYGELLERVLPNGRKDTLAYNQYGQLARHKIFTSTGGQPLQLSQDLAYTYPLLPGTGHEKRTTWVDSPLGPSALADVQTYDPYGRLLKTQHHALKHAQLLGLSAAQHKAVNTSYEYDDADRTTLMKQEVMQGGSVLSTHSTRHTFSASQGAWETKTQYGEFSVRAGEDALGRVREMTMEATPLNGAVRWPTSVSLRWAGGLYVGRSQPYAYQGSESVDPMVETRRLDGTGRLKQLSYRAVKLDGTGKPVIASKPWGDVYCLGVWGSGCEKPLWEVDIKRDVMGRIASMTQKMRQPVWSDASHTQRRPQADRRHDWRGFGYNDRGFLTKEYVSEHDQTQAHALLAHTLVTGSQLQGIVDNTGGPGQRWDWKREHGAGDLQSIEQDGDPVQVRWRHENLAHALNADLRQPGHELAAVEIEGQGALPIVHDGQGRITQDMHFEYAWDAQDRLVGTKAIGATAWAELMLYDSQGRLIQRELPSQSQQTRFVYDGQQKVAAFDAQGVLQWRAVWGPGLDQLLWWHDAVNDTSYTVLDDGRKSVVGLWKDQSATMALTRSFDLQGRITQWDAQTEILECQEQLSTQRCPAQPGAGGAVFNFGWHTAWQSPLTGLVQMRQRWYSPTLGQFLSHDPLEYADSQNLYAFGAHNPVDRWDPWGLKSEGLSEVEATEQMPGQEQTPDWTDQLRNLGRVMAKVFASVATGVVEFGRQVKAAKAEFGSDLKKLVGAEPEVGQPPTYPQLFGGIGLDVLAATVPTLGSEAAADIASGLNNSKQSYDHFGKGHNLNGIESAALATGDFSQTLLSAIGLGGVGKLAKGLGKVGSRLGGGFKRALNKMKKGGGQCFVAGTGIMMGEEEQRAIEQIRAASVLASTGAYATSLEGAKEGWMSVSAHAEVEVKQGRIARVRFIRQSLDPSYLATYRGLVGSAYVVGDVHSTDITPLLWRSVDVELVQDDDDTVAVVTLLRPLWWLEATGARVGGSIRLDAAEAGLSGWARILDIRADVTIDSRRLEPGKAVVIGTIVHQGARVIELVLDGDHSDPLGLTPAHPLYSADRQTWVPAGEVQVGERLQRHEGSTARVTEIVDEGRRETVYNLEVHRARSYYVGARRVLAHNTGINKCNFAEQFSGKNNGEIGKMLRDSGATAKLKNLFGVGKDNADKALGNIKQGNIPDHGLGLDDMKAYHELARRAIESGKDTQGVQAVRKNILDILLGGK